MNNKLIVILGPTASGKTNLAIKLAQKYNGEIISADSRQIYKYMNIGTAKPSKEELNAIKHHLINIVEPNYNFTLAEFIKLANQSITAVHKKNKIPILAGGTGLYISAITENYDLPKGKIDLRLRNRLDKKTSSELFKMLYDLDPNTAETIDVNNKRRLVRALEYVIINHKSFAQNKKNQASPFDILQIGIDIDKSTLDKKIDYRVEKMLDQGLIDEVKQLVKKYDPNLPSLQTIGYSEIIQYLENQVTLNEAVEQIKIHTHQYAKRQMTWFKRDKEINWIKNQNEAFAITKEFLKKSAE